MYSTKEIASILDVTQSTVKRWQKDFEVPRTLDTGRRAKYSDKALDRFKMIQSLANQGHKKSEIKEQLGTPPVETAPVIIPAVGPGIDEEKLSAALVAAIKDQTELSEKYARSSYIVGQLETEKRFLNERLDYKSEKLLEIEDEVDHLRKHLEECKAYLAEKENELEHRIEEIAKLKAQLKSADTQLEIGRQKIQELYRLLDEIHGRPWWKRLFTPQGDARPPIQEPDEPSAPDARLGDVPGSGPIDAQG